MFLSELYDPAIEGLQDIEDDNSKITKKDLRKTKLSLRQINKLRRMNDVRNFEYKQKLKDIRRQYSTPVGEPSPF